MTMYYPRACYTLSMDSGGVAFPDDPVTFLADCAHWWAWLQQADPDEITRYPENGHLHYSLPPRFP
jgi:hypothetical protein